MTYVSASDVASELAGTLVGDVKVKDVDSGYGLSVKATYTLSSVLAPYAQFKYSTDGYLAYGDRHDDLGAVNAGNFGTFNKLTSGVTEIIAGADYKLTKNLTLNGEAKLATAGEKIYSNTKGEGFKEKSAFTLAAAAVYTF